MKIVERDDGVRIVIEDTMWYPCTWKLISKENKMAGKGLDKEMKVSDELREIVKEKKLSRKKVTQALWKHIKKHKLNQQHEDGRIIQCDEKMEPIFKKLIKDKRTIEMRGRKIKIPKGAIFMTEIAGAISKHLS